CVTRKLNFKLQEQVSGQSVSSVRDNSVQSVFVIEKMDTLKIVLVALFALTSYTKADEKVVCYYDSRANSREVNFDKRYRSRQIRPVLPRTRFDVFAAILFTDMRASIQTITKMVPLNEPFDVTRENYRHITDLKRRFPGLRVLLSVGGGSDVSGEGSEKNIVYRNLVKQFFVNIKHSIVGESVIDEKADEHKEQFIALVREVRNNFRHDGLLLTLSVLPNVNSSVYYDPRQIAPHVDFVILHAYDFYTPQRNPKEADYPAPLYELIDRKVDENGDFQVRYWLQHGCPNNKLIFGIPTYGRAWKMDDDSGITGVPPLTIDGPAEAGPYTNEAGLLSYPEVCTKIATPNEIKAGYLGKLRKVNDPTRRYGTYAYRLPKDDKEGIWVAFEDPDTAGQKASYVKAKGLGGVAIVDITLDDFRGLCTGDKYPLLRAAKFRL
ncbi:hypothetical protein NQ317_007845, partial [Molorchus minor]